MANKFGNAPLPVTFEGATLKEALHDYQTAIIGMFQDAADAGHPIKVHTLQIIAPGQDPFNNVWTITAFIQEDISGSLLNDLKGAVAVARSSMKNLCDHEFGADMKCIHCGAVL